MFVRDSYFFFLLFPRYQQVLFFYCFFRVVYFCSFCSIFSCCPLLLSSSFQLFICLLLGCLFRLSNDKCILRANIGKNKMWFELDGSLPLLLLLLLSHIMLESHGISILFFSFSFSFFLPQSLACSVAPSIPSYFALRCSRLPFFLVMLCVQLMFLSMFAPNASRLIT